MGYICVAWPGVAGQEGFNRLPMALLLKWLSGKVGRRLLYTQQIHCVFPPVCA